MGDPNSDDPNNYPPDFYQEQSMYQQLPHQQYQYHQHQMHMMFANTYQNFMHMYNHNTPYGYHPHNNPRNRNNRNQGRGKKGKRRMKKRRDENWRKNASAPDANKKPSETKSKPFSFSINATEFVPASAQKSQTPDSQAVLPEPTPPKPNSSPNNKATVPKPTPPKPTSEPPKTGIWAQMVMNHDTGKKKQGRVGRPGNARPTSADSQKSFQSAPPMKMSSTSPNRVHSQSASSSPIEPPTHYPPHSQPPKGGKNLSTHGVQTSAPQRTEPKPSVSKPDPPLVSKPKKPAPVWPRIPASSRKIAKLNVSEKVAPAGSDESGDTAEVKDIPEPADVNISSMSDPQHAASTQQVERRKAPTSGKPCWSQLASTQQVWAAPPPVQEDIILHKPKKQHQLQTSHSAQQHPIQKPRVFKPRTQHDYRYPPRGKRPRPRRNVQAHPEEHGV